MDDIDRPQFSTVVFYSDGNSHRLCEGVSAWMAADIFKFVVESAERLGGSLMTRVIITDGGDCTAREWTAGKGITIPESSEN